MPPTDFHQPPECFGVLDHVFPLAEDGLRHVSEGCAPCPQVKDCLRAASQSRDGLSMRINRMEAMSYGKGQGISGFLRRWAELKQINQKQRKM